MESVYYDPGERTRHKSAVPGHAAFYKSLDGEMITLLINCNGITYTSRHAASLPSLTANVEPGLHLAHGRRNDATAGGET